jgi:hypothetical protein
MINTKVINNKELTSYDEYVFDGERWVKVSDYVELLELMSSDIDEYWNEKDMIENRIEQNKEIGQSTII